MDTLIEAELKNLDLELDLELEGMKGKEAKSKKQETRIDEVSRM